MENKIKLISFDINKTLISNNTWGELNKAMGMSEFEDEILMKWHEEGIIGYGEAQKIIERLYRERGKATLVKIKEVVSMYTYKPFIRETINYLKDKGYEIAIVSASMDVLAGIIANDLGVKYWGANNIFEFDYRGYLSKFIVNGDHKMGKCILLNEFCQQLDIELSECAHVGDDESDVYIFNRAGMGITFKGYNIETEADIVIETFLDLKKHF